MSLKLSDKNADSRALKTEEILKIKEEVTIPNLSLNLNISEYKPEDIQRVSKVIKPNSLNLFIEANSLLTPERLSEIHIKSIEAANKSDCDIISFGNGFGYDGPSSIPNTLGIYKNLKFMEVNIDTLGMESMQRIKSRKEWSEILKIDKVKQRNLGDTILESISESMQGRPYLVDDRNIEDVQIEALIEIGAMGITLSLNSLSEDEYTKKLPNANCIATMFELEKIIEITKRIKKYG